MRNIRSLIIVVAMLVTLSVPQWSIDRPQLQPNRPTPALQPNHHTPDLQPNE